MKKRFIAVVVSAGLISSLLMGCANSASGSAGEEAAAAQEVEESGEVIEAEEQESVAANGAEEVQADAVTAEEDTAMQQKKEILDTLITVDGDPDFAELSIPDWMNYEFNRDYADIFTDITSYSHEDTRKHLDTHWSSYLGLMPYLMSLGEDSPVSEGEAPSELDAIRVLTDWHNARVSLEPTADAEEQRIYLWERGNVPSTTEYTENTGYQYADDPGFEPFMIEIPMDENAEVKGTVLLCSGGGHMYRSNVEEGYESALALTALGYKTFIVNYRIAPYTNEESALDVARAVRLVRANAYSYGIDPDKIAVAGFSYGGIAASNAADMFYGENNASKIVEGYEADEIDAVSADMNVYLAIYSVVPDEVTNENFPSTFFCYGSADTSLWDWGFTSFTTLKEMNIPVELHTYSAVPHGFGAGTHADGTLYENAATWPQLADIFMQNVYNGTAGVPQQ